MLARLHSVQQNLHSQTKQKYKEVGRKTEAEIGKDLHRVKKKYSDYWILVT